MNVADARLLYLIEIDLYIQHFPWLINDRTAKFFLFSQPDGGAFFLRLSHRKIYEFFLLRLFICLILFVLEGATTEEDIHAVQKLQE